MKKIVSMFLISVSMMFCITALPVFAATSDEAIITSQDGEYEPLYTLPSDSSHKIDSTADTSRRDYALFYTQTTFLALLAGYLILFKVKGINHGEKMHRRRNLKLK